MTEDRTWKIWIRANKGSHWQLAGRIAKGLPHVAVATARGIFRDGLAEAVMVEAVAPAPIFIRDKKGEHVAEGFDVRPEGAPF